MDKINLDTLIEAAKFVELQDVQSIGTYPREEFEAQPSNALKEDPTSGPIRASPPLEKRAYQHHHWVKGEPPYHRENRDEDLIEFRRRAGAGTREVHNKLEKNRRAHLKECFELVKKQLPTNQDDKKASNLNILHNAIKYIQTLRRKEREHEHEMERLAREKIALQQKFAGLKKELSAQWDHIDFNTLIPDGTVSDHEEVNATSDTEEVQRRSLGYSSTSSLSSAATAGDDRHSPRSPKHIPSDGPKLISFTSRLESTKRPLNNSHGKPAATHLQLPMLTTSATGQISATIVSPAIQLVTSSNIRMLPGDQSLTLSLSHASSHASGGVALMHKTASDGDTLNLIHGNGIRGKNQPISLTIPNGALPPGISGKNGTIYKQSSQSAGGGNIIPAQLTSSITHVVAAAPIPGSHGTLVAPVPVTVVSQGNPVAHFFTAPPGKVVAPLSIKPIMSQYLVKPGAAMVVVSQSSAVSQTSSK